MSQTTRRSTGAIEEVRDDKVGGLGRGELGQGHRGLKNLFGNSGSEEAITLLKGNKGTGEMEKSEIRILALLPTHQ